MKRLIYTLFILLTICYSCDGFLDVRPTGEIVNMSCLKQPKGLKRRFMESILIWQENLCMGKI